MLHNTSVFYRKYTRLLATAFALFVASTISQPLYASNWELYYSMGQEYMQKSNFDMAVLSFEKAVQLSPDSPEARNALGEAYFQVLRFKDALKEFDKAIELKSDYTQAKINRSRTIRAIERYEPVKGLRLNIWKKLAIVTGVIAGITAIALMINNYYS